MQKNGVGDDRLPSAYTCFSEACLVYIVPKPLVDFWEIGYEYRSQRMNLHRVRIMSIMSGQQPEQMEVV